MSSSKIASKSGDAYLDELFEYSKKSKIKKKVINTLVKFVFDEEYDAESLFYDLIKVVILKYIWIIKSVYVAFKM